jgi:hypothetical protein
MASRDIFVTQRKVRDIARLSDCSVDEVTMSKAIWWMTVCLALSLASIVPPFGPSVRADDVIWTGASHGQVVTCHGPDGDYQVTFPNNGLWNQSNTYDSNGCLVAASNWSTPTYPDAPDVDVLIGAQSGVMSYPPDLRPGVVVSTRNLTIETSGGLWVGGTLDLNGQMKAQDGAVVSLYGDTHLVGQNAMSEVVTEGSGKLMVGDGQGAYFTGKLALNASIGLGSYSGLEFDMSDDSTINSVVSLGQNSALSLWGDTTLNGTLVIRSTGTGNSISTPDLHSGVLTIPIDSHLSFDGAQTFIGRKGSGFNLRLANYGTIDFGNAAGVLIGMADQGGTGWVNDGLFRLSGRSVVTLDAASNAGEANLFTFDNRNGQILLTEGSSLYLSRDARILGGNIVTTGTSAIRVGSNEGSLSGDIAIDATLALDGNASLSIWGDTTLTGTTRIITSGSGNYVFASANAGPFGVQAGTLTIPQGSRLFFDGANTALGRNSGVVNGGTVDFNSATSVQIGMTDQVGIGWVNDGQFSVRGGSSVTLAVVNHSGEDNSFTFANSNGQLSVTEGSSLRLSGRTRVVGDMTLRDSSTLRLIGGGGVRGGVDVGDGRIQLEQGGGSLSGSVVGTDATLRMDPATDLTVNGELRLAGSIEFESNSVANGANRILSGGGGSNLVIESGATASFVGSGGLRIGGQPIINQGTAEFHPGFWGLWELMTLQNAGLFHVLSGGYQYFGVGGYLNNAAGEIRVDAGGTLIFENQHQFGGSLVVDGTLQLPQVTVSGELRGSG